MPKRSLNLHETTVGNDSEEENMEISFEEYMSVPQTRDIIINQHYFDFEEHLYNSLTTLYRKHAYLCSDINYLKDMEMVNDLSFFNFIYQHIYKNYNNDFIIGNSLLENSFLENIPKEKIKSSTKKINIQTKTKKFDWATKSYK